MGFLRRRTPVSRDGHVLGSFCVVDRTPRLWSERDIALLQDLAASAVTEIELRREMAQRGQAELGRWDNEEQLYSTFEHAGVGMALLSLDGRWIRVNRALADLLGSSPEQLIGLPAETRTHPEDLGSRTGSNAAPAPGAKVGNYTVEKR